MKAIRVAEFGGPEVLRLEEVPEPAPGAGEVLVEVRAAGVNPVETYIRAGRHAVRPPLPYTPGVDGAGVVAAVGEGVGAFAPGNRVYLSGSRTGTYAERAVCLGSQVHALPERTSFAQGAALGVPYVTAYRALFGPTRARPGETVLVHGGSGGVGIATIQLARAAGLRVIASAGSERGRELVREQGAHEALDHGSPEERQALLDLTGGRGVDLIVEMLANVNLARDLTMLAQRGRVVLVGSRGPIEIDPREAMVRNAAILGVFLYSLTEAEVAEAHAALGAALESGAARPIVAREMPLAEAPEAHEAVLRPGAAGKIVLVP